MSLPTRGLRYPCYEEHLSFFPHDVRFQVGSVARKSDAGGVVSDEAIRQQGRRFAQDYPDKLRRYRAVDHQED